MTADARGLLGALALAALVLPRGGLARILWREAVRALTLLDLALTRAVRRLLRPRYALTGSCCRRGVCCQQIVGDPPRLVKRAPRLLALYAAYHRAAHRFVVVARGPNDELIFSCGHLRDDGRCGIYRYRPRICRDYPQVPVFGPPRLLPGCGYQAVARSVQAMRPRASLRILNATVAVHHPTPPPRPAIPPERPEDYHLVAGP